MRRRKSPICARSIGKKSTRRFPSCKCELELAASARRALPNCTTREKRAAGQKVALLGALWPIQRGGCVPHWSSRKHVRTSSMMVYNMQRGKRRAAAAAAAAAAALLFKLTEALAEGRIFDQPRPKLGHCAALRARTHFLFNLPEAAENDARFRKTRALPGF